MYWQRLVAWCFLSATLDTFCGCWPQVAAIRSPDGHMIGLFEPAPELADLVDKVAPEPAKADLEDSDAPTTSRGTSSS